MKIFSIFYKCLIFKGLRQALARGRSILKQKLKSLSITKFFFRKSFGVWKIGATIVLYSNANNNGKE